MSSIDSALVKARRHDLLIQAERHRLVAEASRARKAAVLRARAESQEAVGVRAPRTAWFARLRPGHDTA